MSDAILVALISGLLTLAGTCATVWASNKKTAHSFETAQAVMEERVAALTAEVRKHNHFAERIPVLEERVAVANHRIADLEARPIPASPPTTP